MPHKMRKDGKVYKYDMPPGCFRLLPPEEQVKKAVAMVRKRWDKPIKPSLIKNFSHCPYCLTKWHPKSKRHRKDCPVRQVQRKRKENHRKNLEAKWIRTETFLDIKMYWKLVDAIKRKCKEENITVAKFVRDALAQALGDMSLAKMNDIGESPPQEVIRKRQFML